MVKIPDIRDFDPKLRDRRRKHKRPVTPPDAPVPDGILERAVRLALFDRQVDRLPAIYGRSFAPGVARLHPAMQAEAFALACEAGVTPPCGLPHGDAGLVPCFSADGDDAALSPLADFAAFTGDAFRFEASGAMACGRAQDALRGYVRVHGFVMPDDQTWGNLMHAAGLVRGQMRTKGRRIKVWRGASLTEAGEALALIGGGPC